MYPEAEGEDADCESAFDDLTDNGRFVGKDGGMLVLNTPGTRNKNTSMRVEVWAAEPPADTENWMDEVDADFDLPDGRLVFVACESGVPIPVDLPANRYRARVSGSGYTETGDAGSDGDDFYRLQLWPRTEDTVTVGRKTWPGHGY
jgi:hypothetical protein